MRQKVPGTLESQFFSLRARPRKGRSSSLNVSRTRCSALRAAPQSRDLLWARRKSGPRISSAPPESRAARSRGRRAASGARQAPLNPSSRPFPLGIPQAPLENLAGILARQIFEDFDVFWHFVIRQRSFEPCTDRRDVERYACLRFH